MNKISEDERDIPAVALSAVCTFIGGVAFQGAADVIKASFQWNLAYWAGFVGLGTLFFVLGILIAFRPIKRAQTRQKEISNRLNQLTQKVNNQNEEISDLKSRLSELEKDRKNNS